jgi:hypothetical protein
MRLSRDDVLKAEDITAEEVDVPEWGGSVLVRGLTGRERDEFEVSMTVRHGGQMVQDFANLRARLVARCIVDEDGQRLFTDSDVAALGEKSAAAIDRVFTVASQLSGLGEKDVEELTANFGGPNGVSSSSASPPGSAKRSRNSSPRQTATS